MKTALIVLWLAIFPVDSAIQLLNNRDQCYYACTTRMLRDVAGAMTFDDDDTSGGVML